MTKEQLAALGMERARLCDERVRFNDEVARVNADRAALLQDRAQMLLERSRLLDERERLQAGLDAVRNTAGTKRTPDTFLWEINKMSRNCDEK